MSDGAQSETATIFAAIESLRAQLSSDIEALEKMGEDVLDLRKKFRGALQQLDILAKKLHEKDIEIASKDKKLAEQDRLIVELTTTNEQLRRQLERMEGERISERTVKA